MKKNQSSQPKRIVPLKKFLQVHLENKVIELISETKAYRKAIRISKSFVQSNAKYTVTINSYWKTEPHISEGEKNVTMEYDGRLEDAIHKTESRFMKINNRSDVQGEYFVRAVFGEKKIDVPVEYWRAYIHK